MKPKSNFRNINVKLSNILIEMDKNTSNSDDLFQKFIEKLYYFSIPNIIINSKIEDYQNILYSEALDYYRFIKQRNDKEAKIQIHNLDLKTDSNIITYSVIKIINDDKPFLLDSIKNLLAENNIKIHEVIHPIIKIKRDSEGEINDILDKDDVNEKNIKSESIVQLYVDFIANHKIIKNLLEEILLNIRILVEDWHGMLKRLEVINEELTINNISLNDLELLKWLAKDNFTFLGYKKFILENNLIKNSEELGFLKTDYLDINSVIESEGKKIILLNNQQNIIFGKLNLTCLIHRKTNLEYICVKIFNNKEELISVEFFIGLFTTNLNYQSVKNIPIIREKVHYVIDNSGFAPASYSRKELLSILDSLPREELFQFEQDQLFYTSMNIYDLTLKPKLKLFIRKNVINDLLNCIIFIPKESFSIETCDIIINKLQKDLNGHVIDKTIQVSNLILAYIYVIIRPDEKNIEKIEQKTIENNLEKLINAWSANFKNDIFDRFSWNEGETLFKKYKSAFPNSYREKQVIPKEIAEDIILIEKSINSNKTVFRVIKNKQEEVILKIYNYNKKINLSEIMPILDNMGFNVIDESTFCIHPEKSLEFWLHEFQINIIGYENLTISELKEFENFQILEIKVKIEEALTRIFAKEMQNDSLNKLIVRGSFSWREVVLVRALTKYLRQAGIVYGNEYIEDVLTKHPKLVKNLIELFFILFDPNLTRDEKLSEEKENLINNIDMKLSKIHISAEDKIIRVLYEIIKSMLRTNYFQLNSENCPKDYISFKLNSIKVPELPLPIPFREIFVYSPRIEGIHLRGGKVARGGIRWSDRSEDFRTEILGLMKAQMTKNAVIVPVGSKGGFVVKNSITTLGREEYNKEGKECYKIFLKGMLDITDNIVRGKIVSPENIVKYDDNDPYLVVAADKGTASFSDIANKISAEYNFWLGDAFASGGSDGYDHKKMGITARGAWISVVRHFNEIGLDAINKPFTVVGIGDMSGDVFGNGMLSSQNICLIGAFNHIHIFIDPKPNSKTSFIERERLFRLPSSNWTDYNRALISSGGGIFERSSKFILLSDEIKALLSINDDQMTPDDLIIRLLTTNVDLLWNGGIGTYVKASDESNLQVGDKNNDNLRVNGNQLKCKIVAEGGNLGFTQKGRIEYALSGGLINTDAIDNSAGVDCSDHEVNIKIAFNKAIEQKKISLEQRNKLLEQMTTEVASLVLRDNELQTQAITLMEKQGYEILEMNERLINRLESIGMLNREVEFLPSKTEINRRNIAKLGLTRPEIAILLAYSKITIYKDLIESNLPDDPYFHDDLALYFPKLMRETCIEEINNHPLKREIITTSVTNSMVNRIGNFFFHFALEDTGLKGCDIARAYSITRDIFDLRNIWREIESYDSKIDSNFQIELFMQINKLVQRSVFWFLRNTKQLIEVSGIVNKFKPGVTELSRIIDKLIVGSNKEKFLNKLSNYKAMNIKTDLALKLAKISVLANSCDIISISIEKNLSVKTVCTAYYLIGERFKFDLLSVALDNIKPVNYWQRLSLKSIKDELYDQHRTLTNKVLKHITKDKNPLESWCKSNENRVNRYMNFINDLFLYEILDESMVNLAVKRISLLLG